MNEYIYLFIAICILLIYYISSDNNEVDTDLKCQHLSKIESDFKKVIDIAKNKCRKENSNTSTIPIEPIENYNNSSYNNPSYNYIPPKRYYNTNTL